MRVVANRNQRESRRRHRLRHRNTAAAALLENKEYRCWFLIKKCYRDCVVRIAEVGETQITCYIPPQHRLATGPVAGTSQGQADAAICRARVVRQEKQCSGTSSH
jgi:hypothetical protein